MVRRQKIVSMSDTPRVENFGSRTTVLVQRGGNYTGCQTGGARTSRERREEGPLMVIAVLCLLTATTAKEPGE